MASFATTREAVTQDRRNAERYGRTLAILENLHRKLDRVRAGLAGGRQDLLSEYVAAVHEQLSLEHRQWLKKGQDTLSALAKLRDTLAQLENSRANAPGPPAGRPDGPGG